MLDGLGVASAAKPRSTLRQRWRWGPAVLLVAGLVGLACWQATDSSIPSLASLASKVGGSETPGAQVAATAGTPVLRAPSPASQVLQRQAARIEVQEQPGPGAAVGPATAPQSAGDVPESTSGSAPADPPAAAPAPEAAPVPSVATSPGPAAAASSNGRRPVARRAPPSTSEPAAARVAAAAPGALSPSRTTTREAGADPDVDLVAALMAHAARPAAVAAAAPAAAAPPAAPATPMAERLRRCATRHAHDAQAARACRRRACEALGRSHPACPPRPAPTTTLRSATAAGAA